MSHKHHSIICVGADLIQFVYGLHSHLATEATRDRNPCSSFFVQVFFGEYGFSLCQHSHARVTCSAAVCCGCVLQCVVACGSIPQRVAACCSALKCATVCYSAHQCAAEKPQYSSYKNIFALAALHPLSSSVSFLLFCCYACERQHA